MGLRGFRRKSKIREVESHSIMLLNNITYLFSNVSYNLIYHLNTIMLLASCFINLTVLVLYNSSQLSTEQYPQGKAIQLVLVAQYRADIVILDNNIRPCFPSIFLLLSFRPIIYISLFFFSGGGGGKKKIKIMPSHRLN